MLILNGGEVDGWVDEKGREGLRRGGGGDML